AEEAGDREAASGTVAAGLTLALACGSASALVAILLWSPFASLTRLVDPAPSVLIALAVFALVFQYFQVNVHLARLENGAATLITVAQPVAVAAGVALSYLGIPIESSKLAAAGGLATGLAALAFFSGRWVSPSVEVPQLRRLLQGSISGTTV